MYIKIKYCNIGSWDRQKFLLSWMWELKFLWNLMFVWPCILNMKWCHYTRHFSEIFACHLTSLSLLKTKYMGLNNFESLNDLINAFLVKFITWLHWSYLTWCSVALCSDWNVSAGSSHDYESRWYFSYVLFLRISTKI